MRMFRWAELGVTPSAIAGYANALRWTPGGGNSWTARQVLAILRNHVYAGLVTHDSRLRQGCHPALIDREAYDDVQRLISGRRTGARRKQSSGAGITWILRGLLRCGGCGRLMSTHTVRSGPAIHGYYRCRSTAGGREHARIESSFRPTKLKRRFCPRLAPAPNGPQRNNKPRCERQCGPPSMMRRLET